jgi:hypothetical protein
VTTVVVVLLVVAAAVGGLAVVARTRRRKLLDARWEVVDRALAGGAVVLELRRPGEHPVEVARIPADTDAATFSDRMAEARSEAEERAAALNASRGPARLGR